MDKFGCKCDQFFIKHLSLEESLAHPPYLPQFPVLSPPTDDFWKLQFCRWWGWYWVKFDEISNKLEDEEVKSEKLPPSSPRKSQIQNRNENLYKKSSLSKQLKELCKCIFRCSKEKRRSNYNNLYSTPTPSMTVLKSKPSETTLISSKNEVKRETEARPKSPGTSITSFSSCGCLCGSDIDDQHTSEYFSSFLRIDKCCRCERQTKNKKIMTKNLGIQTSEIIPVIEIQECKCQTCRLSKIRRKCQRKSLELYPCRCCQCYQ